MTLADQVDCYYRQLRNNLAYQFYRDHETGSYEADYICDHESMHDPADPSVAPHSMFFARLAAEKTNLPPWLLQLTEAHFKCSCEILNGYQEFVRAAIADLTQRGEFRDAEHLRNRLDGLWDAELYEAIEEVCHGDAEALEVLRRRFNAWQQAGDRRAADSLRDFLDDISDPLLVSVARESLRRQAGPDWR